MYTVDGVADILSRCDDHREGQEDHRGDAPGVHGDYDDDLNGDDDGDVDGDVDGDDDGDDDGDEGGHRGDCHQEDQERNHQNCQTNIT